MNTPLKLPQPILVKLKGQRDPKDSGAIERDTPGGPRQWSARARHSWKAWRSYYPSLAYAREDPHTFYVPIDRAAHLAGLARPIFIAAIC